MINPLSNMIRQLIFDFDGVLIDSNTIKRQAYFDIFTSLDSPNDIVQQCLVERQDGNRYQVIECILQRLMTAGKLSPRIALDQLIIIYAQRYNDICENYTLTCREVFGASVCLPRLARRYNLYINSATPEEPLRRVVTQRGWDGYFREVLGSSRSKVENLRWIIQNENTRNDAVIFVGDGERDLRAARECGCHFVGVRNPDNDFNPTGLMMVDDLYSLENLINDKWGKRCLC